MLVVVSILVLLGADLIKAPSAVPTDHGSIIVSAKKGGRRWTASWTMEPSTRDGRKVVRFTERGEGRVSPFSEDVRWSLESVWLADGGLQPLDSEKIITTPAGERVSTERKHFDLAKQTVQFDRQPANGRVETKTLSVSPDTLAVEGIAGVLRFLPFELRDP